MEGQTLVSIWKKSKHTKIGELKTLTKLNNKNNNKIILE